MRRPFRCGGIFEREDDKQKGKRCRKILAYLTDGGVELKCTNCKKITLVKQSLLRRPGSPNSNNRENTGGKDYEPGRRCK